MARFIRHSLTVSATFSCPWIANSAAGLCLCSATKRALWTNMPPEPQAGVENPTVKRLQHLDEQANDADRRIELAAPRTLRASELTEEILIDPPERVAFGGRVESPIPS